VEIGRRAVSQTAALEYKLRLDMTDDSTVEFTAEAAQLRKMKAEVEAALREEKDTHSQRFQRYCN
jgi:hypothetical protein